MKLQNSSVGGGSAFAAAAAAPVSVSAASAVPCLVSAGDAVHSNRSAPPAEGPAPLARPCGDRSASPGVPPLTSAGGPPSSRLRTAAGGASPQPAAPAPAHPCAAAFSSVGGGTFLAAVQHSPTTYPAAAAAGISGLEPLAASDSAASSVARAGAPAVTLNGWKSRRAIDAAAASASAAASAAAAEEVQQKTGQLSAASSSSSACFPSSSCTDAVTIRATFRQLLVQVEHQLVALSDLSCEVKKFLRRRNSAVPDDVGLPRAAAAAAAPSGPSSASSSSSVPLEELYNTFLVLQTDVQLSLTRAGRVLAQLRYQRSAAELAAAPSAGGAGAGRASSSGPAGGAVFSVSPGSCCTVAQLQHFSETLETLQTEAADSVEALAAQFDRARLQERAAAGVGRSSDSSCSSEGRSSAFRRSRAADEGGATASVAVACVTDEVDEDEKEEKRLPRQSGGSRKSRESGRSKSRGRRGGQPELEKVAESAAADAAFLVREEAALGESNLLLASVLHVGGSALDALRAQRNVLRAAQAKLHDMQNSQLLDVRKLLDAIAWRRRKNKVILAAVLAACVLLSFLWVARTNFCTAATASPLFLLPLETPSAHPARVSPSVAAAYSATPPCAAATAEPAPRVPLPVDAAPAAQLP